MVQIMVVGMYTQNETFSYIKNHLEHHLEASDVSFYCKDKDGKYLSVNQSCLSIFQQSSDKNIIGFTDFDFFSSSCSQEFRNNDNKVILTEKPVVIVERNKFIKRENEQYYLSHKMPLRSRTGKVIGILGQSIQYAQSDISLITSIFYDFHRLPIGFADLHAINHLRVKYQLTKRQAECVFHLAMGKTKKEIAQYLHLSVRTIETYWNQIKDKLNCNNRSHLIEILHEKS